MVKSIKASKNLQKKIPHFTNLISLNIKKKYSRNTAKNMLLVSVRKELQSQSTWKVIVYIFL